MLKNFCLAITLMITVLFIFGCGQQEKAKMEHPVSEKRETIPEDTSGMDEHAAHTPTEKSETTSESDNTSAWMNTLTTTMHRWRHPQMQQKRSGTGLVLCIQQSKCKNQVIVQFVRWI